MTNRRSFLAAAALLAGCGGGEEEVGSSTSPDARSEALPQASLVPASYPGSLDALCASARHAIFWGDAAQHEGMFAPNRSSGAMPTRNVLAFSTGPLVNESGSVMPTKTNDYLAWWDAGGSSRATRLQSTAPQMFYLYRPSKCPPIPPGRYGLRFRCRATPGTGDQAIRFGLSNRLMLATVRDVDWSQPAHSEATTFSLEFDYLGDADIAIRLLVAGTDILIDRLQLYRGGLAAIPSWAEEVAGLQGGRKGFCYPGAIPVDQQGHWTQAPHSGGGWILEPGLADHAYENGVTVLHACALDDLKADAGQTLACAVGTRNDARLGTTLNTFQIGFQTNASPYEGQVTFSPSTEFPDQTCLQALGHGIVVLGQAADARGRRMFVNEIPMLAEKVPFPSFKANCWHVGAATSATRAHVTDFEVAGRHAVTLIWDRALSNEEWANAALLVQQYLAKRGGAVFPDFHVFSGDSNWTKAVGDVMQLLSAHDALSPGRNLWARDTSVGGTGIAEVYGREPYPAPPDPYGRLLAVEVPMIQAALRAGRKVVYHLLWGTNDFTEISGVPAWGIATYNRTRQAVVEYLLDLHPNVWVQEYTVAAAGSRSGRHYSPAVREEVNRLRRVQFSRHVTIRYRLCDFGGPNSVLGNQTIADSGTYLLEPPPCGVHFSRAGDRAAASILQPNLIALRRAMHVPA